MQGGTPNAKKAAMKGRTAPAQLAHEPLPFVTQLTFAHRDAHQRHHPTEFRCVEGVAATLRFGVNYGEIAIDRGARCRARAKTLQLRVMPLTSRAPAQHFACEQRFAPQCDQALGVEIPWMEGPQAHACWKGSRRAGGDAASVLHRLTAR